MFGDKYSEKQDTVTHPGATKDGYVPDGWQPRNEDERKQLEQFNEQQNQPLPSGGENE